MLLIADDDDVVEHDVLGHSHLLIQGGLRVIDLNLVALHLQSVPYLVGILNVLVGDREDRNLTRRKPEGPATRGVLTEDSEDPLDRAEDGAMDHDRALVAGLELMHPDVVALLSEFLAVVIILFLGRGDDGVLGLFHGGGFVGGLFGLGSLILLLVGGGGLVAEAEAAWKHKVQLNGSALMRSSNGIVQLDIDLGSIERAVSWVDLPLLSEAIKCLGQLLFCGVPAIYFAEEHLWAGRELKLILETEESVDVVKEMQAVNDLTL